MLLLYSCSKSFEPNEETEIILPSIKQNILAVFAAGLVVAMESSINKYVLHYIQLMIQQKNESRDILESLEESIIIIDGDKTISFVNDKFVNQFKKLIEPLNEPPKIIEKQNFLSCFKKKKR